MFLSTILMFYVHAKTMAKGFTLSCKNNQLQIIMHEIYIEG